LSHSSSPFCSGYFWRWGSHELFAQVSLDPQFSQSQPPK
jgi:hypothetical protein